MIIRNRSKALLIGATCAAVGAAGGIVGSMAAPTKHRSDTTANARPPMHRHGPGGFRGAGGPAVHAEEVVLNKAGTAFITRTEDSGKVKSVSGSDVTITEAIGKVTYKDVTVTIPDGAAIVRNGAKASLADLKAGDFVHVDASSDGTDVFAADSSWRPQGRWGQGPGRPDAPPPGPAPAPQN